MAVHDLPSPPGDTALGAPRHSGLADDAVELVAARFQAISEPARIRLIRALREGRAGRQALTGRLGISPQSVSKHLGVLRRAGFVERHRDRGLVEYELVDWTGWWRVEKMTDSLGAHLDSQREALGNDTNR